MLSYRAMLECKSAATVVHDADPVEASKYKAAFCADVCAIVGTKFGGELELVSELQTHGVSAFTIDDLQQLLRVKSNPHEMRPLFEPGFAEDHMGDLLWERAHGAAKRLTLICDYLRGDGWAQQFAFAQGAAPDTAGKPAAGSNGAAHPAAPRLINVAEAPRLTVDAAMMLVDEHLRVEGSIAACTRAEIETAFAYMTSPLVGTAQWWDAGHDAIVILPPSLRWLGA